MNKIKSKYIGMPIFKKFGGELIGDIVEYVKAAVTANPNLVVSVGCDSQNLRRITAYVTTVVMYDIDKRNGAHIVFKREYVDKTRGEIDAGIYGLVDMRLYGEISRVVEIAEILDNGLKGHYVRRDIPLAERSQYRLVDAHLDFNPDIGNGHNKSNKLYAAGKGTLEGLGFRTFCKPNAWAASCAADLLVK